MRVPEGFQLESLVRHGMGAAEVDGRKIKDGKDAQRTIVEAQPVLKGQVAGAIICPRTSCFFL
jgi:hypothetical protein